MRWLIKTIRRRVYVCVCEMGVEGWVVMDQTVLNGHRRALALVQRVNGDIFLQFGRWKK